MIGGQKPIEHVVADALDDIALAISNLRIIVGALQSFAFAETRHYWDQVDAATARTKESASELRSRISADGKVLL